MKNRTPRIALEITIQIKNPVYIDRTQNKTERLEISESSLQIYPKIERF